MSGTITPEMLSEVQRQDRRFHLIRLGIETEEALRQDRPLFLLMAALREDADEAMKDFAVANPGDVLAITSLQARVFRFRYALDTFNRILATGESLQREVMAEDQVGQ